MTQPYLSARPRFKTFQDWHRFIPTLIDQKDESINTSLLLYLRQQCYLDIERLRGRPLLVYISKFLTPIPPGTPNSIDISDIDGFTDLISSVDDDCVDVMIHSPGGSPEATERLVQILRCRFKEVHFLIPHSAYSAATMLALSGDSISIHANATLGPIDPQINGTPARSITRGFEKVRDIVKAEGPEALPAYLPLIEKYSLDLLEICDDSEKLAKELVCD